MLLLLFEFELLFLQISFLLILLFQDVLQFRLSFIDNRRIIQLSFFFFDYIWWTKSLFLFIIAFVDILLNLVVSFSSINHFNFDFFSILVWMGLVVVIVATAFLRDDLFFFRNIALLDTLISDTLL
jgi:hypothetical protein